MKEEKLIAISQSNYLPWKGYFDMINSVDEFYLVDSFQFTRHDWRNRNQIKTRNGPLWISIPIASRNHFEMSIENAIVEPSLRMWRKKHWRSIESSYRKARFFEEFKGAFEPYFTESEEENLSKINEQLIRVVCGILGIKTPLIRLSIPIIDEDKSGRIIRLTKELGATGHLFGPNVRNYLKVDEVRKSGIQDYWMDYSNYPQYEQLYPPFIHQLSVIDLIFNTGPEAPSYMKSFGSSPTYTKSDEDFVSAKAGRG